MKILEIFEKALIIWGVSSLIIAIYGLFNRNWTELDVPEED